MLVTLLGMVIEVREEQPEKAELPIEVTLLGMMIEVREEQPEKASEQMNLQLSLILHDVMEVFFALNSAKYGFSSFPRYIALSYSFPCKAEQL